MIEKEVANMHGSGIVNLSLDLNSRQVAFTIDGILVPAQDVFFEKFVIDGENFISFAYTVESTTQNGMTERRQFFLPRKEDASIASKLDLNAHGFASKILNNVEKAKADIIDFFKKD